MQCCNVIIKTVNFSAIFPVDLSDYKDRQPMCHGNETVEEFANCIVEHTKDNIKMDNPHTRSNRVYYENVMPSFLPEDGAIGFNETTATLMNISFSTNTSFTVWFMDRNFAFSTLNPSISPRAALDINQPGVVIFIYLKVREKLSLIKGQPIQISMIVNQATRKTKLSRESSPCEPAINYDFNSCIQDGIAKNIGCKPFWISKSINGLTNCTEASDLFGYLNELKITGHMDEQSLLEHYSCLKPCSYTEYQVFDGNIALALYWF